MPVLGTFLRGIGVAGESLIVGDDDGDYFEDGGEISRAAAGLAAGIATEASTPVTKITGQGITSTPPMQEVDLRVRRNIDAGLTQARTVSEQLKEGGRLAGNAPRSAVNMIPMQEATAGLVPKGNFLGVGSLADLDLNLQRVGATAQVPDVLASRRTADLYHVGGSSAGQRVVRGAVDLVKGRPVDLGAPVRKASQYRPLSVMEVYTEFAQRRALKKSADAAAEIQVLVGDPSVDSQFRAVENMRSRGVPEQLVDVAIPKEAGLQLNMGEQDLSKRAKVIKGAGNLARVLPVLGTVFDAAEVLQEISEGDKRGETLAGLDFFLGLTPAGLAGDAYVVAGGFKEDGLFQGLFGDEDMEGRKLFGVTEGSE